MAICKHNIDVETLKQMYEVQQLTAKQISQILNVDKWIIDYQLKVNGIATRTSGEIKLKKNQDLFEKEKNKIEELYLSGKSVRDIQRMYSGIGYSKISEFCKTLGDRLTEKQLAPRPCVSEDTRKKLSDKAKFNYRNNPELFKNFRIASRLSRIGKKNHNYGKLWSIQGRGHRVEGLGCSGESITFRSSWEKKFADYLNSVGVVWEYEKHTFECSAELGTYTPDFYIIDWDCFIEVKGWMLEKSKKKIDWFRENIGSNLVLATRDVLRKQYNVKV